MGFRTFVPLSRGLSRLRAHHQHGFPGIGARHSGRHSRPHASMAENLSWCRILNVAVMGCIVNGPGESKHADIGISLPGTGEAPAAPVFIDGRKVKTLRGDGIANEFEKIVEDYVAKRFGGKTQSSAAE